MLKASLNTFSCVIVEYFLNSTFMNRCLEAKKARADAKAAEEAKKAEAESVLKKLLAEGMSADEILEKLK